MTQHRTDIKVIKFEMTEEDIRLGCAKSSTSCPIARAIHRALGGEYDVAAFSHHTELKGFHGETRFSVKNSPQMTDFIYNYDDGFGAVEPFSETLVFQEVKDIYEYRRKNNL